MLKTTQNRDTSNIDISKLQKAQNYKFLQASPKLNTMEDKFKKMKNQQTVYRQNYKKR